jgi:catechol 2,3-dioxygenase-like lactoylglutathione lyase family enzyme
MAFSVNRIDHVVTNCSDVDATTDWYVRVLGMRREVFRRQPGGARVREPEAQCRPTGAPNWKTGAVDAPGSLDRCFIAEIGPDDIGEHPRSCGVTITEGPVTKTGALGPMTSHYCRDRGRQSDRGRQLFGARLA